MRRLRYPLVQATISVVFALSLLAAACGKKKTTPAGPANGPTAATASGAAATTSASFAKPRGAPIPKKLPMPAGPVFAVLAGQGLGPIRFGATVQTIERLMEAPCEQRSATMCRYTTRAVEFHLGEDGTLKEIHVHRPGRPAGGDSRTYGMFHGAIPPDVKVLMLPWAVQQMIGKPLRVEKVLDGGAFYTEERHYYEGMLLEYDRLENGNLVLGGIVLTKKP